MLRWALLFLLCLAPLAPAQTTSFHMDENGNWVAAPARPMTPDEELIAHARQLIADNKASAARSLLTSWIDEHEALGHPLLPQAYLLRGDAITAGGNEFKALYDYEALIKSYPESEEFNRALERELEIAIKYVYGLKRIWLGVRWSDAAQYGEELLVRVQERSPGSTLAERAGIELADYYYRNRDLKLAADAYEIFLANFPKSRYAEHVRQRRIWANIARFKGPNYDASGLAEARVLIEDFTQTDPAAAQRSGLSDAMVSRLDESTAAQILNKARWYLKRSDLVSARFTLQRLVATHPQTVAARTGLQMLDERGWERPAPAPAPASDTVILPPTSPRAASPAGDHPSTAPPQPITNQQSEDAPKPDTTRAQPEAPKIQPESPKSEPKPEPKSEPKPEPKP